jgi:nucleotide-binding universal stress UspA family protein
MKATPHGTRWSRQSNSPGNCPRTLRMVHVVEMYWLPIGPELAIDTGALTAARRRAGETTLTAARELARTRGFDAEAALIETETPLQHIAAAIANDAVRWRADLLVLGTHGRRGFQHLMLGSVAEKMMRVYSGAVLLIPSPTADS